MARGSFGTSSEGSAGKGEGQQKQKGEAHSGAPHLLVFFGPWPWEKSCWPPKGRQEAKFKQTYEGGALSETPNLKIEGFTETGISDHIYH